MIHDFYKYLRTKTLLDTKFGLQGYFVVVVWLIFAFWWCTTHPAAAERIGLFLVVCMPFTLPYAMFVLMKEAWYEYGREKKYWEREYCVLEIKLPEDITQGPYSAELMLRGLYQTGVDRPTDPFFGSTLAWFSLEMVSTGGQVRFYMWGRRAMKQLMESQIYAHYPTVQVVEVPDYTLKVPYDPAIITMQGIEQALQKPDPYPIITYKEIMTLEPGEKEEFKNDPLASMIEALGSIKEGEHTWMQIIFRAHEQSGYCPYALDSAGEELNIEEWAKHEIDKIAEKVRDEKSGQINFMSLTQGEKRDIEAIQTKLNKQLFEVGIRTLFIADKNKATTSPRVMFASAFRAFEHGSEGRGLNGLRPVFWIGPFNFPWHDLMNIRRHMLWRRFYNAYVTRQFFFTPHKHRYIVLNAEEIATLYHFPGQVVRTPTLVRQPSRRAEAPANLPV